METSLIPRQARGPQAVLTELLLPVTGPLMSATSFPLSDAVAVSSTSLGPDLANIYLHARYYDPVLGVFLSPDPAGADLNTYRYGLGNPVNFSDPSGLAVDACEGVPGLCFTQEVSQKWPWEMGAWMLWQWFNGGPTSTGSGPNGVSAGGPGGGEQGGGPCLPGDLRPKCTVVDEPKKEDPKTEEKKKCDPVSPADATTILGKAKVVGGMVHAAGPSLFGVVVLGATATFEAVKDRSPSIPQVVPPRFSMSPTLENGTLVVRNFLYLGPNTAGWTMGNVIFLAPDADYKLPHERAHVPQGYSMGPTYPWRHLYDQRGGYSESNELEAGPSSEPPRAYPSSPPTCQP